MSKASSEMVAHSARERMGREIEGCGNHSWHCCFRLLYMGSQVKLASA